VIVAPGTYRVRLTSGGESRTAPLVIVPDPRVPASGPAIAAKTALAIQVVADIDALHQAVNAIRDARKALPASAPASVRDRLEALEEALMQVNMKGSEANLAFPGMLNEQLAAFAETLEDADSPPTSQQQALYASLHARLGDELDQWRRLQGELGARRP
jgi:hypothetical protein